MSTPSESALRAAKYIAEKVRAVEFAIEQRDAQPCPFTAIQRNEIRDNCERECAIVIERECPDMFADDGTPLHLTKKGAAALTVARGEINADLVAALEALFALGNSEIETPLTQRTGWAKFERQARIALGKAKATP